MAVHTAVLTTVALRSVVVDIDKVVTAEIVIGTGKEAVDTGEEDRRNQADMVVQVAAVMFLVAEAGVKDTVASKVMEVPDIRDRAVITAVTKEVHFTESAWRDSEPIRLTEKLLCIRYHYWNYR